MVVLSNNLNCILNASSVLITSYGSGLTTMVQLLNSERHALLEE